jgi:hypothetical protein
MGVLDRNPVLKRAIVNQYQAILLAGAAAFAALTASGLPLLLFAGFELMALPFVFERLKRRLEIEKKYAAREAQTLSQEQQFEQLPSAMRGRFAQMRQLCERIQKNYRGLSPESQGVLAEQSSKFDAVLASYLKRLWLLDRYDEMVEVGDDGKLGEEIAALNREISATGLAPRVREALAKNREIKAELLRTLERNAASRDALRAEIDSLESLLQLLLQKSVAATDAAAFSVEIDDVLSQVQADAASVEEMERMLGAAPALGEETTLSPKLRQAQAMPPPPPPPSPARGRQRG